MHLTILTFGSRGDVQPYVALGVGLKRAGYTVRIAAPARFESFVREYGLEFAPLPGDPEVMAQQLVDEAGTNMLSVIRVVGSTGISLASELIEALFKAVEGTDGIIYSFIMLLAGHTLARMLNIPDFFAAPYPMFAPTAMYPHMLFPELPLGSAYNRFTHKLYQQVFWQFSHIASPIIWRKYPQLPPLVWPLDENYAHRPSTLHGFSPNVIPPGHEWGEDVYTTGFWYLDADEDWQPSQELVNFLEAGPPPVYVGFGSMVTDDMDTIKETVLAALKRNHQRAVLLSGWGNLRGVAQDDDIFMLDYALHDWLFPRMAAVVHHGGVGTTAAGLRAGVPSIIVPFTADQPYWGKRVMQLGVGPEPIHRKQLTVDKLAYALRIATTHQPMKIRAAALGRKIQAEDGVGNSVRVINRIMGND